MSAAIMNPVNQALQSANSVLLARALAEELALTVGPSHRDLDRTSTQSSSRLKNKWRS